MAPGVNCSGNGVNGSKSVAEGSRVQKGNPVLSNGVLTCHD